MTSGITGCGLRYAVRRSGTAAAYCALSIRCGTRDEAGYSPGIAHFVEPTLFKGTARKSAETINGYLDRLGGELNAYTTKEEIVLHATVLKEDLNKAAGLLFEIVTSPSFPEDEIETEKSVIIDEIKSYKDSPSEDIYDRFEEMLYAGHPLSTPILGTAASIRKIRRKEIEKFVKEKFVPEKMAFTVVADIDEKLLEKFIIRLSSKWFSGKTGDFPENTHGHFAVTETFDRTVCKKNHQANCIVGSTAPSLYEENERIPAILLCNILGGPAGNSILNSELREKRGLVYGVDCSYTQYSDTGIAAISLGCDKDNLGKCLSIIDRELRKLQDKAMSERRLNAAKRQFFGQMAIASDSGESQCLSMGKSLLAFGSVLSDSEIRSKIDSVTAGDIQNAARKIFAEDKLSRLIYI